MTALAVVRHDLDWSGFAIVMGMLALMLLALLPGGRELFRRNDDWLKNFAQQGLDTYAHIPAADVVVVDHKTCVHDDCDQILCYCRTATRCLGAVEPGCGHSGAFVCDDHRLDECGGCRVDARDDARDAVRW